MAGTERDRLKSRVNRVGEVYALNHLKAGQANSQLVAFGCHVSKGGTSDRQVVVSAGEIVLAQSVIAVDPVNATSLPSGASTSAGQFRKVLLELDAEGALSFVVGDVAASQAKAPLPDLSPDKIAIAYIELPASFTVDTTSLTDSMIVNYDDEGSLIAYFDTAA